MEMAYHFDSPTLVPNAKTILRVCSWAVAFRKTALDVASRVCLHNFFEKDELSNLS